MFGIKIDRNSGRTLTRQVYDQLKEGILRGRIREGAKLPSTRTLASELGISRNIVLYVYDWLLSEGYIESRRGSGTVVAGGARLDRIKKIKEMPAGPEEGQGRFESAIIDFRSGIPAVDLFPLKKWGRILHQIALDSPGSLMTYGEPEGRLEARKELAAYLYRTRGLDCRPEQLFIVTGATQGLVLAAQLLSFREAEVIMEDPSNAAMQTIFRNYGYEIKPVPVDERGIQTGLIKCCRKTGLIYVTPSHQFPLGAVLPVQRRIELVQLAHRNNYYIVEDDYDSEFRHNGPPISSIWELDPERVVYIGSISKILAPALRLGYIILPETLIRKFRLMKRLLDVHTPTLEQLALAVFIREGLLERHIAKVRKVYAKSVWF